MYSPEELRKKLARQWDNAKLRAERLLPPGSWPLCLPIGKPSARMFAEQTQYVLQHVQLWRQVTGGRVDWEEVSYRASGTPVLMPLRWILNGPSDWINAAAKPAILRSVPRRAARPAVRYTGYGCSRLASRRDAVY